MEVITFKEANDAATKIGRYLSQGDRVTVGQTRARVPSLADQAKKIMQKIIHSAYPKAKPGKPNESVAEQKRLNLASAFRNFFGLFVSKKNSVYDPKANETNKQQRSVDYRIGLKKFYDAKVSGIENLQNTGFDLITDQGLVNFSTWDGLLFEPLNTNIKDNVDKFMDCFGRSMTISPDKSFNLKNYTFVSARSNALDISLKAFSYLQEHIEEYKSQIENFDVFRANIDILLAGLQNLKSQASS